MQKLFKKYFGHEVKIQLVRESKQIKDYEIASPNDAYKLVKDELTTLDREAFIVIPLNAKSKVLGVNIVSIGSASASLVHPREVFKSAILLNASSIVLMHNHPSGDPLPSQEDMEITKKLVDAGKLLGITVVDHIIVGNTFYSFLENNLLKDK